jgi:hypothetical protein
MWITTANPLLGAGAWPQATPPLHGRPTALLGWTRDIMGRDSVT